MAAAPPVETCAECSTPLAGDQRYCLACGARRPAVAAPERPALASAPTAAPASALAFLAALGVLLLALGVGVLIGRSGDRTPATATTPPPQVITVSGAAPAAAAAAPAAGAAAAAKPARKASRKAAAKRAPAKTVSKKDLQNLGKLSPQEYQKRSQKLPKQVVTQGKAPKVDKSKPAGGGTSFQDIG